MHQKNISSPHRAFNAKVGKSYPMAVAKPKSKAEGNAVLAKIISEYKDNNRKDIQRWRQALQMMANPEMPKRYLYHDIIDDLSTDGHLRSQMNLRIDTTLGYDFEIVNKNGDRNDEATKFFQKRWFYRFARIALHSPMRGTTLLELINPETMQFDLIPYRNIVPDKKIILLSVNEDNKFVSYESGFENRIIEIGEANNVGILNDIIPQLIWKRNAQQSWAEYSEKFGMPLITMTTNKTNPKDLDDLEMMLANLAEAARGILPVGSTIDVKPFSGGDSFKVYDEQINRCNSEISKALVGGTMVSDNGSSQSQANVHERNLDDKIGESDRKLLSFVVNDSLIPLMQFWGVGSLQEGDEFVYPDSFDLDLVNHWGIVSGLISQGYVIPEDFISKTFNVPIEGKEDKPVPVPFGQAPIPEKTPEEVEAEKKAQATYGFFR